jgi:hypothetical protein
MEADFMSVNKTYDKHIKEMKKGMDHVETCIVGRKYFKSRSPNFLTYSEKEQIRNLHEKDSIKWSIDKLSQSFPADPQTIHLILKSYWQPKDTNRIWKHDLTVKRNWEAFNSGKLDIDPILVAHLKKFALRDINKLTEAQPNKKLGIEIKKPKGNEFLSIISSCKKYSEENDESISTLKVKKLPTNEIRFPERRPQDDDDDTFVLKGKHTLSNKSITLNELQLKIPEIKSRVEENANSVVLKYEASPVLKVKETRGLTMTEEPNALGFREKIKIPRKLWQKGKTYRVDDCFYADDGEFLYKVPGLKS